jgi:gamma-glutamylcyclotransferase
MWYFAYGSNLDTAQMIARTGWAGRDRPRRALLRGYRLVFDMSGGGQAFANIVRPGCGVQGVMYWLDLPQLDALDRHEEGYDRIVVGVETEVGPRLEAMAYVARPDRITTTERPAAEYVRRIVLGAQEHGLPAEYIRSIEAAAGISDQQ